MEIAIQKWGNSLALRIPKALAHHIHLSKGSKAELVAEDGALVLRPLRSKRWKLESLVAGISTQNVHSEIPTGKPHGREAW